MKKSLGETLKLQPAELLMLVVGLFVLFVDLLMIAIKGSLVDWQAYLTLLMMVSLLFPLGMFYRISGRSEQIASSLICTAAFVLFTASLSVFNYLMLPLARPVIDTTLANLDWAIFGYYWPSVMQWAADNPVANIIMKIAYSTTMPQMALLVVILGLGSRIKDLHVMIVSVTITGTLTICFWGIFPTLGAKSMYTLPPELWAAVSPIVDEVYALDLLRISKEGPGLITPSEIRGLIAFPSYHAVLAFTALYAARNIPVLNIVFLVLNLLILPAIFIHGGHHFVDLLGGFAMFVLGTVLANLMMKAENSNTRMTTEALQAI